MSDVRELVDGSTTVRVYGLDAKAASVGNVQLELETIVANGLRSGNDALTEWRGRRAETFVEDANGLLRKASNLVGRVTQAKRTLYLWPTRPGRPPRDEENATSPRVEVPEHDGTSSANPDKLDNFRLWCEDACLRLRSLTGNVNLDGVTADVTRQVSVTPTGSLLPSSPVLDGVFPDDHPDDDRDHVGGSVDLRRAAGGGQPRHVGGRAGGTARRVDRGGGGGVPGG